MEKNNEHERFKRSSIVLGEESFEILSQSSVTLFGLGGVGSYIAEALARSGVGRLVLVDADCIDITNCNRQLPALESTIGKLKTQVIANRLRDINPNIQVIEKPIFFLPDTPQNEQEQLFDNCNYIADAIDTITAKIYLAQIAKEKQIPLISAMGCGNKIDNTKFKIADISKTKVCPVCKIMRRELKKRKISSYTVVYSEEEPIKIKDTFSNTNLIKAEIKNKRKAIPGSVSWVPGTAGLIMAGKIIQDIIKKE